MKVNDKSHRMMFGKDIPPGTLFRNNSFINMKLSEADAVAYLRSRGLDASSDCIAVLELTASVGGSSLPHLATCAVNRQYEILDSVTLTNE